MQAVQHLDLQRVLTAQMHFGLACCAAVLGHQVYPASRGFLIEAALVDDQRLRWRTEGQLHGQSLAAFERLRCFADEDRIGGEGIRLDLRIDLLDLHIPASTVRVYMADGADLDPADVELIDAHINLEFVEQVDLSDALPGIDVLSDLRVNG